MLHGIQQGDMKGFLATGSLFFLFAVFVVWAIGESSDGVKINDSQTGNTNISVPVNDSHVENRSRPTSSMDPAIKVTTEDDLISDFIKPTVAPATPQDDLTSNILDSLGESLTSELKLLPKRSVLHTFDTSASVDLSASSAGRDKSLPELRPSEPGQELHDTIKAKSNEMDEALVAVKVSSTPSIFSASLIGEGPSSTVIVPRMDNIEGVLISGHGNNMGEMPEKEKTDASHDNLETFAEWREKQGLKKQEGESQSTIKPKAKKNVKRKQVNYASADCGAKVIASNSEASNLAAMLNENKDVYMLSPCKSKTWFVVELCERIQVESIEIANYELFSSTPKSFNVFVSSRHPTRDWQSLGTFHARDERQLQRFPLEEKNYAKFVKVEMLSHFGSEHYCPVSLFRVSGTSEVDEFEDSENTENDHDGTDAENAENVLPVDPKSNNAKDSFIESAKDAVLDMVTKAVESLTKKTEQNTTDKSTSNIVHDTENKNGNVGAEEVPLNVNKEFSQLNTTDDNVEVNSSIVVPLRDESDDDFGEQHYFRLSLCHLQGDLRNISCLSPLSSNYLLYVLGKKQCPVESKHTDQKLARSSPKEQNVIVDKGGQHIPNESSPDKISRFGSQNFVLVSETRSKSSLSSVLPASQDTQVLKHITNTSDQDTLQIEPSQDASSSLVESPDIITTMVEPSIPAKQNTDPSQSAQITPKSTLMDEVQVNVTKTIQDTQESLSQKGSASVDGGDVDVLEFTGYENGEREGRAVKILSTSISNGSSTVDNAPSVRDTESVQAMTHQKGDSVDKLTMEPNSSQKMSAVELNPSQTTTSSSVKGSSVSANLVLIPNTDTAISDMDPKISVLQSSSSAAAGAKDIDDVSLPLSDKQDPHVSVDSKPADTFGIDKMPESLASKINTAKAGAECTTNGWSATISTGASGGTKESLLVKLKTRVRLLEANLSLSTQYLEQMSQRYKAAMEEQRKKFEKKLNSLNQSFAKTETRMTDYEEKNRELLQTVSTLSKELESVRNSIRRQNEQIAENYAFLVLMQIVVTMIIVWSCRSRRPVGTPNPAVSRRSSEPNIHLNYAGTHGVSASAVSGSVLCSEESAKEEISPNKSTFALNISSKKKRQKRRPRALDCNPNLDLTKPSPTIMSTTAGLLFSAGKGLLSGLAGAFSPSYMSKQSASASRRTDALVGEFSDNFPQIVRRTRSYDLPVIEEDDNDILPRRPRSCDDLFVGQKSVQNGGTLYYTRRSGKQSG